MAKRKTKKSAVAARTPQPRAKKKGQSRREVERVLNSGVIRRRPKAQALPGMEEAVSPIPRLSKICASLSDVRHTMNDLKGTEKGLLQAALPILIAHKRIVYKDHGIELVHVHGDDKVRARLVDDDSTGTGASEAADGDLDTGAGESEAPAGGGMPF
mgnify:CR=1 FL=1